MPTRNVVLTDHQSAFIEKLIESGHYQNASEALRDGVRLLERQEAEHAARLQALRNAVQVGIDDIEAGRSTILETSEDVRSHFKAIADHALEK